ncbi:MAG: thiamine-phosphate kinase, partial [Acidobacteriota bacterium]
PDRRPVRGEDQLIDWLRKRAEARGWHLIGDDAASLPAAPYLVTVDTQIAGVHFPPDLEPRRLARRLLAVNLSDLAAMGAEPAYAFLALSAPRDFAHVDFFRGLFAACDQHGVELAGGDLSTQPRITAALTLHGRPGAHVLRRGDAEPGHRLYLGGPVGESALGCRLLLEGATLEDDRLHIPARLKVRAAERPAADAAVRRHLEPRPQLALGAWLAERGAGAAIDLSDGLSRDLHRLCRASDVGAVVDMNALAAEAPLESLARRLGTTWRDAALAGGEDYVLLFTLPESVTPPPWSRARAIGTVTEDRAIRLRHTDGTTVDLPPAGWDHLA